MLKWSGKSGSYRGSLTNCGDFGSITTLSLETRPGVPFRVCPYIVATSRQRCSSPLRQIERASACRGGLRRISRYKPFFRGEMQSYHLSPKRLYFGSQRLDDIVAKEGCHLWFPFALHGGVRLRSRPCAIILGVEEESPSLSGHPGPVGTSHLFLHRAAGHRN